MQIAIVEDLVYDQNLLADYINQYFEENQIGGTVALFSSGEEFFSSPENGNYDILFLDIYFPGMTGMQIAKQIREKDIQCLIIFTTASESHAIESFQVRAFHYLLKPFSFSKFTEVMDLAVKKFLSNIRYIEVKEGKIYVKILLKDILYIDLDKHYIQIHTENRIIKSRMDFETIRTMLIKDHQFLMCYRNILINMDKIISLQHTDFIITNEEHIPIKKSMIKQITQSYTDYIFHKIKKEPYYG